MEKGPCIVAFSVVAMMSAVTAAEELHVPSQYPTIQHAIVRAVDGDEVVVAPGTYHEAIFFNGFDITVRSSGGPGVTTIDATGFGQSAVRVVSQETATLRGFTITGGQASNGGGLEVRSSTVTVEACSFAANVASSSGGAINVRYGNVVLEECAFIENTTAGRGGAINVVLSSNNEVVAVGCRFIGNTAEDDGGAAAYACSFGGCQLRFVNCLFTQNSATSRGGVVYGGADFINSTLVANTANSGDAFNWGTYELRNTIVWDHGTQGFVSVSMETIDHCCIQYGWPDMTNSIIDDPEFIDSDYRIGIGSPCVDSADDGAVPVGVETDLDGADRFVDTVDMGAYEFQGEAAGACCLRDGSCLSVSAGYCAVIAGVFQGVGVTCEEADCRATPPCDADINGDGVVNFDDLLQVLDGWGPCPG